MKKYVLTTFIALASACVFWNCSDDSSSSTPNNPTSEIVAGLYPAVSPSGHYWVYPDGTVYDVRMRPVGTLDAEGNLVNEAGVILETGFDWTKVNMVTPGGYVIIPDGTIKDGAGNIVGNLTAEGNIALNDGTIVDGSGNVLEVVLSSSSVEVIDPNTGLPVNPGISSSDMGIVDPNTGLPIIPGISSSDAGWVDPNTGVVQPGVSSSSVDWNQQWQSSSSENNWNNNNQQNQQSSSSVSSNNNNNSTPVINYVSGGESGSGWATRYWDCCKPSCSWTENAGGNTAKQCNVQQQEINDASATSMCDGGNAGTCLSQIPMVINDNLALAFAAVPAANGGKCGRCFALEFTGTGKYETKGPHKAIKGKTLIVMASNVGADVEKGQFDIMIPGGGVGMYNGCSRFGWGAMGQQYGGLLSDCESEVGYDWGDSQLTQKRKECLTTKCNSTFSSDAKAKEGCLFLATWMEAAGNPMHNYREVECPAQLLNKY